MSDMPEDFSPFPRSSPFLDLIGPLCWNGNAETPRFGFRVDERHANARGFAHGGVLTTIADLTLGYTVMMSAEPPPRGITVNLTTDFAGSARIGDWTRYTADSKRQFWVAPISFEASEDAQLAGDSAAVISYRHAETKLFLRGRVVMITALRRP